MHWPTLTMKTKMNSANKIYKRLSARCLSLFIVISAQGALLINQPALAVESATISDSAKRLRTLFTTPLERKKLDELRKAGEFDKAGGQSSGAAIIREPLKVEVKGIVYREAHKPVVFVNKGNTMKSQKIEDGVSVRPAGLKKGRLKVPVRVYQKTLSMKPGQYWTETDKKVRDNYQIKQPKPGIKEAVISLIPEDN